jgi:hypothetical protein
MTDRRIKTDKAFPPLIELSGVLFLGIAYITKEERELTFLSRPTKVVMRPKYRGEAMPDTLKAVASITKSQVGSGLDDVGKPFAEASICLEGRLIEFKHGTFSGNTYLYEKNTQAFIDIGFTGEQLADSSCNNIKDSYIVLGRIHFDDSWRPFSESMPLAIVHVGANLPYVLYNQINSLRGKAITLEVVYDSVADPDVSQKKLNIVGPIKRIHFNETL